MRLLGFIRPLQAFYGNASLETSAVVESELLALADSFAQIVE
jgi:hypothetical protein